MSDLPQAFIDKTLELVETRGPLPWQPGWAWNGKAAPLTNSHREALRQLEREGKVVIDHDADDGIGKVWAPGAATQEERLIKRLERVPRGSIFIVGHPEAKALCLKHLRDNKPGAGIYVVCLGVETFDIARRLWPFMKFARPFVIDSTFDISPAAMLEVTEHNLAMEGRTLDSLANPDDRGSGLYHDDPDMW